MGKRKEVSYRFQRDEDRIQTLAFQAFALIVLILMSWDPINPIKAIAECFEVSQSVFAALFSITLVILIHQNLFDALYFCIQTFLHSILSIFFKTIDIVGAENIPQFGPVIFTGNHANQFVDGVMVMMNCNRKVGFLVAEKSWNRAVLGDLMRAVGCIPVVRPQDAVEQGIGVVTMKVETEDGSERFVLHGENTQFTKQIQVGDQVRCQGKTVKDSGAPIKVLDVVDDVRLELSSSLLNHVGEPAERNQFGIFKKVDQSKMFSKVYEHLKRGKCIGIFPEGGSHDRTDLLPLKAGIAIMAFGVRDQYGINVPVVPVGLNYFRGHRFRARVVIEFGHPLYIPDKLMKLYATDRKAACNTFLADIEEGMRAVIVTAPNYNIMKKIYCVRRLYQRTGIRLSPRATQDLNRRFAEGYKLLMKYPVEKRGKNSMDDIKKLETRIEEYQRTLKRMGLSDHQVPYVKWWGIQDAIVSLIYSIVVFGLASIPSFVLNAPVGLLARYAAQQEQKKALAGSKVKIAGRDVVLSKKILFSIVAVPSLWITYLLIAIFFTQWKWSSIVLLFLSCPVFSYFGVRTVEAGMIEFKTILPLFYRLLPKYRTIQDNLPRQRSYLQLEVREFVKKYRDELGDLAKKEPIDWKHYMHWYRKESDELIGKDKKDQSQHAIHSPILHLPTRITNDHDIDNLCRKSLSSLSFPTDLQHEVEAATATKKEN